MSDAIEEALTEIEADDGYDYGREWAYDFEKNQFVMKHGTPLIVTGKEALKIYIVKALKTVRYRYPIYSWDYGCEIEDILGKTFSKEVIESEIKRMIIDALIYDDRIEEVGGFEVELDDEQLRVSFRVKTVFDDEMEVTVNV